MAYDSNSYYGGGRLNTETQGPGLGLPAQEGNNQLAALLGPAMAWKQQMAQRNQAMAEAEHAQRLAAARQQMALEKRASMPARGLGSGTQTFQMPHKDTTFSHLQNADDEHSFVQNVWGGPQMQGGFLQAPAGTPRAVYGGYVPGRSQQLRGGGGGNFTLSGGPVDEPSQAQMQAQQQNQLNALTLPRARFMPMLGQEEKK